MGTAKMKVTRELFLQLFSLPEDTKILGAFCEYPFRDIKFIVQHPDIPDDAQNILPVFVAHYAKDCGHVEKTKMTDWGATNY